VAAAATLTGNVGDAAGAPVVDAKVTASPGRRAKPAGEGTTNADGRYTITGLGLGKTYEVAIEVEGGRQERARVTLDTAETTYDINMPLGGPTVASTTTSTETTARPRRRTTTAAPAGTTFEALEETLVKEEFAAEAKVNIEEARELARLFVLSMFLIAQVPRSIEQLYSETRPTFQVGDLTIQGMDQLDPAVRAKMQSILDRRTQLFDTEQAILEEMRSSLDLGTAAVPSVNADFKLLYRELVGIAADDRLGADPEEVKKQEAAQAAVIYSFLGTLKRAMLRMTQNLSVYGTRGTATLVEKWSGIVNDSLAVLLEIGEKNVVSPDQDDKSPWSLLAAVTGTPRSTVKSYVVNARNGGELLKLTIGAYKVLQDDLALDQEDDKTLHALFFERKDIVPRQKDVLSVEMRKHGAVARDHLTPLWP
jgi:hypothetical protein